jgi:hypothetical protein
MMIHVLEQQWYKTYLMSQSRLRVLCLIHQTSLYSLKWMRSSVVVILLTKQQWISAVPSERKSHRPSCCGNLKSCKSYSYQLQIYILDTVLGYRLHTWTKITYDGNRQIYVWRMEMSHIKKFSVSPQRKERMYWEEWFKHLALKHYMWSAETGYTV